MNKYSDNIDMFDAYLNGTMSVTKKAEFESQLNSDPDLLLEFRAHMEFVASLQHVGQDADREFGNALKHISDNDLEKIVGFDSQKSKSTSLIHNFLYKKNYGLAAMIVTICMMAGLYGFYYQQTQSRNKLCDTIFTAGFNPDLALSRNGNQNEFGVYSDAVEQLKLGKTNNAITILEELYNKASDELKIEYGTSLAYAYVKAHNIKKAWEIISNVKTISLQLYGELPIELQSLIQVLDEQNLR